MYHDHECVCVCHWRWECKSGGFSYKKFHHHENLLLFNTHVMYIVMWINTRNYAYSLRCRCGWVSDFGCLLAREHVRVWFKINVYACDLRIIKAHSQTFSHALLRSRSVSFVIELIKGFVLTVNPFVLIIIPNWMCVYVFAYYYNNLQRQCVVAHTYCTVRSLKPNLYEQRLH